MHEVCNSFGKAVFVINTIHSLEAFILVILQQQSFVSFSIKKKREVTALYI